MAMEEQLKKINTAPRRQSRRITILSGFTILVIAVALVTAIAFQAGRHTGRPGIAVVDITSNGFQPATLSVKSGTEIVWTNKDTDLHQIVANPFPSGTDLPSLRSEILNGSQGYVYTTGKTGTFGYHDQLHPTVNGTVIVKR